MWEEIRPEHGPEPERVRPFMDEARDFGIVSGVSFALQGPSGERALLSLASRRTHARVEDSIVRACRRASYSPGSFTKLRTVFGRARPPGRARRAHPTRPRMPTGAAEGKTTTDIARLLALSERTVVFHMRNAARKLGVRNRAQAVARAIAQAHVVPQHLSRAMFASRSRRRRRSRTSRSRAVSWKPCVDAAAAFRWTIPVAACPSSSISKICR